MRSLLTVPALLLAIACGNDSTTALDAGPLVDAALVLPPSSENWLRDILSYDLEIDLANKTGRATIVVVGGSSTGMSLAKGNLVIKTVTSEHGPLEHIDLGTQLNIGVPAGGQTRRFTIDYSFTSHGNFDGWLETEQVSFLWPTFCGNLYPCHPDPAEGATFTMAVRGASGTAIYPKEIPADAPSYMPAIAVGDFTELALGTTSSGTEVSVWYQAGQEALATAGTTNLVEVFDFLETTYGAYTFGNKVGTVSADWGGGDFGGMEHHPFWHVSSGALSDEETNAHEAAHGWFGNGVRIACWEDFVLSEGVVTYMAARALQESGVDVWPDYDCKLKSICGGAANTTVLLDSCGDIDIINHPLWSSAPYQKGAQYFREVAALLGEDVLDATLAEFYQANVGQAARMEELVTLLKSKGQSAEIEALTTTWLRTETCPANATALCP